MAYRYICNFCGAFLDPGEHCDCKSNNKIKRKHFISYKGIKK